MKNKKIERCLIFVLIAVVIFSTMTSFVWKQCYTTKRDNIALENDYLC